MVPFCISVAGPGVRERDLAGVRCQQAKDLIMAVDESILREEPVDRHNKNGVAFVSGRSTFSQGVIQIIGIRMGGREERVSAPLSFPALLD